MKKIFTIPLLIFYVCLFQYSFAQNDTIQIKYEEVTIGCLIGRTCHECIITNEADYKTLLKERSPHNDCANYELPYIDFNTFTLIGNTIATSGCKSPEINKEIVKISKEKKYILKVNIKQNGRCQALFSKRFWIIIPKIESDYTIEFGEIKSDQK